MATTADHLFIGMPEDDARDAWASSSRAGGPCTGSFSDDLASYINRLTRTKLLTAPEEKSPLAAHATATSLRKSD